MRVPERKRLFFALWPGPTVSAHLAATARAAQLRCGGRLMRQETVHLTLVFIGDVAEPDLDNLHLAASRVNVPTFSLSLDRYGCWRRGGIVWAGCVASPALAELAGQLAENLGANGVKLERREFAPHVTLLRNAQCGDLPPFAAIDWPVADFVLVESQRSTSTASYAVIGRWPLT